MTTVALLIVLLCGVMLNALLPERIFTIVAALATFATIYVWLMILVAHIASRRTLSKEQVNSLAFPVPLWPWGQYFSVAFIIFTFGIMVWEREYWTALGVGVAFLAIMSIFYFTYRRSTVRH